MIAPACFAGAQLEALRALYRQSAVHCVLVPAALDAEAAARLRAAIDAAGMRPFAIADQGRYRVNDTYREEALLRSLLALAQEITGAALTVGEARWTRLAAGDYALLKESARLRAAPATFVELTLDHSNESTGEAETVYTDGGGVLFGVPQLAGSVALVERGPALYRYDRYLTQRVGSAEVHRLRLALLPA